MPAEIPSGNKRESRPRPSREPSVTDSLYRIATLGNRIEDPREALSAVLEEMLRAFPVATSGSISLIAPDSGRLEIEVQVGLPRDATDVPLKSGEGVTGWVALHGKPLRVCDTAREARYREVRPGVRSELAVPMIGEDQVIGVANLDSERIDAFSEADMEAFVALTSEATATIRKLWAVRQLSLKASHLESILSVGQSLVARVDLSEILQTIARQTRELAPYPACAILLLDSSGEKLEAHAVSGIEKNRHPDITLSESSAGVAVNRRRQLEVPELLKTEEHVALLRMAQEAGLGSLLLTPIVVEDEAIGLLATYAAKSHRFSDEEKSLVAAMANLGAVAVNNARLYARVLKGEEGLRRSEKLTALGLLAAELAHEIRNPLTVIKLLFQSLDLRFENDDPRNEDLRVIEEKLDHLEGTVSRVLNFARNSGHIHSRVSLHEVVTDTLALTRLKAEQSGIRTEFRPCEAEPFVNGNKGQLQQVVLNLILNSLQAMERGGKLTISTRPEDRQGVRTAYLEVVDTGKGIPEPVRKQAFESFLTEKTDGTGLGLGIAKQIVSGHRGSIRIMETGPTGTRIGVWLPRLD